MGPPQFGSDIFITTLQGEQGRSAMWLESTINREKITHTQGEKSLAFFCFVLLLFYNFYMYREGWLQTIGGFSFFFFLIKPKCVRDILCDSVFTSFCTKRRQQISRERSRIFAFFLRFLINFFLNTGIQKIYIDTNKSLYRESLWHRRWFGQFHSKI